MSRLLRSELKEIVKECLVEILSEGLMNNKDVSPVSLQQTGIRESNRRKRNHLDNISYNKKKINKRKKPKINTNLTKDPIMNEIFADTANSTLQEQVSADRKSGMAAVANQGDAAAKLVNKSTPEKLFGEEAASKWASLAFS